MTRHGAAGEKVQFLKLTHHVPLGFLTLTCGLCVCGPGAAAHVAGEGPAQTRSSEPPPQAIPEWRLEPRPEVVIGEIDGPEEYLFTNVTDATILADGSIVVALFQRNFFELRYFDASGNHLRSVGRWGDGPFEFTSSPSLNRLTGDSILLVSGAHRFSVFGPRGERVRSGRLTLPPASLPMDLLGEDRLVLAQLGGGAEVRDRPWETTLVLTVADLEGGGLDTAAVVPAARGFIAEDGMYLNLPFEAAPSSAAGKDALWVADGVSDTIVGWVSGPGAERRVVVRAERARVTRADRTMWEEFDVRGVSRDIERRYRRHHRGLEYPESMPRVQEVFVDALDDVWVLLYEPPYSEAPYRFEVFDRMGAPLAELSIPLEVLGPELRTRPAGSLPRILEIGADYLLDMARDALGVVRVRRFRLAKGRTG